MTPAKEFKSLPPLYLDQTYHESSVVIEDVTTPSVDEIEDDVEQLFQQLSTSCDSFRSRPQTLDLNSSAAKTKSDFR